MYALIDKSRLAFICRFPVLSALLPEHKEPPYTVIDLTVNEKFSVFSNLEMKILYRNLGHFPGTDIQNRASLERAVEQLIQYRPIGSPAQIGVFDHTESGAVQGRTANDRPVANGVAATPKTGNRAVIWEVADTMWQEAGSPMEVAVVLPLRKQIMSVLETKHGIKKTTSSTALGEWQKVRLNK